jgi:hypothetical protein
MPHVGHVQTNVKCSARKGEDCCIFKSVTVTYQIIDRAVNM